MATHGAPSARGYATGIWTGNRLLVWSGQGLGLWLADGGLYDPISDTWEAISADDVPQAIRAAVPLHAHWTGSELMMWAPRPFGPEHVVLGYAHDPAAGSWRSLAPATSIAAGLDGRFGGARIWTGAEMLIWGGTGEIGAASVAYLGDGAALRFDDESQTIL